MDDSLQDFQARAEDVESVGKPIFASWLGYAGTLSPVHYAGRESIDPPGHIIKKQAAILANLYPSTSGRYYSSSQLSSSSEFAWSSNLSEIDDNDAAIILFKHCSSKNMIACPS